MKETKKRFSNVYFALRKFLQRLNFISIYRLLNKLSEYIYFYITAPSLRLISSGKIKNCFTFLYKHERKTSKKLKKIQWNLILMHSRSNKSNFEIFLLSNWKFPFNLLGIMLQHLYCNDFQQFHILANRKANLPLNQWADYIL